MPSDKKNVSDNAFKSIKVLLGSGFPNPDSFEGVWMDILDGSESDGIGILDNEPFGKMGYHVGDIVRYRTIHPGLKPFVVGTIPLHAIMFSDDELVLAAGQWYVNAATKRIAAKKHTANVG